jgi:hypothetical protein
MPHATGQRTGNPRDLIHPVAESGKRSAKKRVLIVNAYFDDLRRKGGRPFSPPRP